MTTDGPALQEVSTDDHRRSEADREVRLFPCHEVLDWLAAGN